MFFCCRLFFFASPAMLLLLLMIFLLAQSRAIVSICILRIVIDFSTYIEYLKDLKHSLSLFHCAKNHGKVLCIGFDCMGNGREHDFRVESGKYMCTACVWTNYSIEWMNDRTKKNGYNKSSTGISLSLQMVNDQAKLLVHFIVSHGFHLSPFCFSSKKHIER